MKINKQILNDSAFIKKLSLSELRVLKDGDVDWFVLIPLRENIIEWCDLEINDQLELTREINFLTIKLKEQGYDKINIGSLGNIVSQFHVHIIGRSKKDRAWPGPIWGTRPQKVFNTSKVEFWKEELCRP